MLGRTRRRGEEAENARLNRAIDEVHAVLTAGLKGKPGGWARKRPADRNFASNGTRCRTQQIELDFPRPGFVQSAAMQLKHGKDAEHEKHQQGSSRPPPPPRPKKTASPSAARCSSLAKRTYSTAQSSSNSAPRSPVCATTGVTVREAATLLNTPRRRLYMMIDCHDAVKRRRVTRTVARELGWTKLSLIAAGSDQEQHRQCRAG